MDTGGKNSRQLGKRISGGMNSGSPFGAMMGFMNMPWLSRGSDRLGSYAGHPSYVNAMDYYGNGMSRAGNHGGGGNPQIEDPPLPPVDPNDPNGDGSGNAGQQYWKFPQYSQTWAFTPPTPTPYEYPQPFDPKKYGNPFAKSKK